MRRFSLTALGLMVVTVAAVLFAKSYMRPAQEKVQRGQEVLTNAYQAQLVECVVLENTDLPEGLRRPSIDEDLVYVQVTVLYPGVERVPRSPEKHILREINGVVETELRPVHTSSFSDEDGSFLYLVYQTDSAFEAARMARDGMRLFAKVTLD
ncbi:MAG: hypothetical protein ACYTDU_11640 [Planctomycetota bacterium]